MPNIFVYKNQVGVAPIEGERISTNSHYTGEFKGTVMQDATVEGTSQPYERELGIVRYGTVMQDAIEGSTPEVDTGEDSETESGTESDTETE